MVSAAPVLTFYHPILFKELPCSGGDDNASRSAVYTVASVDFLSSRLVVQCADCCRAKPEQQCRESGYVVFCCTRYGSHCSHLRSWWPYKYSWLDIVVPEFFRAVLAQSNRGDVSSQVPTHPSASQHAPLSCKSDISRPL